MTRCWRWRRRPGERSAWTRRRSGRSAPPPIWRGADNSSDPYKPSGLVRPRSRGWPFGAISAHPVTERLPPGAGSDGAAQLAEPLQADVVEHKAHYRTVRRFTYHAITRSVRRSHSVDVSGATGRPEVERPNGRKQPAQVKSHGKPESTRRPRGEPRPVWSRLHCLKPNPERMINGPAATSVLRRRVSGADHKRLMVRQDRPMQRSGR